jgi:hypothetical protein
MKTNTKAKELFSEIPPEAIRKEIVAFFAACACGHGHSMPPLTKRALRWWTKNIVRPSNTEQIDHC